MANYIWVGLDVGADEIHACIVDDWGEIVREGITPNAAADIVTFVEAATAQRTFRFGMEACSFSLRLTRNLRQMGHHVTVFHSYHVSKFLKIRSNKTDRNDARGIAEILRLGGKGVSDVHVKSPASQHIKSQLVVRHNLLVQRMALENVLRSVLRLNGGRYRRWRSAAVQRNHIASEIERLRDEGAELQDDLEALAELCHSMRVFLDQMTGRLTELAKSIEVCRRWMNIPGVGPMTALAFYATVDDPSRFARVEDIGPYLGLAPRISRSGAVARQRGISRRGDKMTRTYLTSAATSAMRGATAPTAMKAWASALAQRTGTAKARSALARKLAIVMLSMWKTGKPFRPFAASNENG